MKLILTFIFMLVSTNVFAQNVHPFQRDVKMPRQNVIEYQNFGAPIAASASTISNDAAGGISAAASTLTTFANQPDVPRNLVITPGSTTADVGTCTIVVNGTDYKSRSISENFAFSANQTTAVIGSKAFKSVSSVVFPANCEDSPFGATWDINGGEKIGLRQCMDDAGGWLHSSVDGVKETTAATINASASTLSLNTADFNGTMDGSAQFKGYFIQNYQCY